MAEGDANNYWLVEPPPPVFVMPGVSDDPTEIPPTAIPPTAVPIPPTFSNLTYQIQEDGIWFLVDADIIDRATQELTVYLWFKDATADDGIQQSPRQRLQAGIAITSSISIKM